MFILIRKTSLLVRYVFDKFEPSHISTVQAAFLQKEVELQSQERVTLDLWDTAGQKKFHSLGSLYYSNADGALIVYDATDLQSRIRAESWIKELEKNEMEFPIIVVASKCDLRQQIEHIEPSPNLSFMKFFKTSAKKGTNIR